MEMPKVSEEQKRLTSLFAGTWRGEEKLHPSDWDPKGGPAFGTWVVHPSLDGFFLLVDYIEERDGKIMYRGHGVHAWDPQEKCFFAYWFDNVGSIPKKPVRATLEGAKYTYEEQGHAGGHTRMTYAWTDDRFEFRIETSKDGATWAPMHEGRYTRG
jgi:hypothetical protein